MSSTAYLWVKAFHVVGILIWGGTIMGLTNLLVAFGKIPAETRKPILPTAMATGRMMDIGATLTIACAVWLAVGTKVPEGWVMQQGWMHVKLTLVVLGLFSAHGVLRAKLGKYRRGQEPKPLPPALVPILSLVLTAIIVLAIARPIGR